MFYRTITVQHLYATLVIVSVLAQARLQPQRRSTDYDSMAASVERSELDEDGLLYARDSTRQEKAIHTRQSDQFIYGDSVVRGVNIGGWLVCEPWITPSLFDDTNDDRVIDEFTFGTYVKDAARRLEQHFAQFYTESDFQEIAAAGLNHVRIPIGYWAIDNDPSPYYKGSQYARLKKAVGWARNAGLKVQVDLHGAPGSQNGFDNSGQRGDARWFDSETNKNRTITVLRKMATDFANDEDTVTSINILNEPMTSDNDTRASFNVAFTRKAYEAIRLPSQNGQDNFNVAVVVHTGFQPLSFWSDKLQPPQYRGTILDTHSYLVFDIEQIKLNESERLAHYCGMSNELQTSNNDVTTIIGEWTVAPTDCAKYLNGRGKGSRYDGTYPNSTRIGSCDGKTDSASSFSDSYKSFLAQSFQVQQYTYETSASGWIWWCWKAENADDWTYRSGMQYGWIPKKLVGQPDSSVCSGRASEQ